MFTSAGRRISGLTLALCGLLAGFLAACVPAPPHETLTTQHPLENRIWSVAGDRFVTPDTLVQAMAGARFVLLGEIHDNPRHHQLQAWAVRALTDKGRHLALVAEMIAADQANALKIFYENPHGDMALLRLLLDWDKSGWPPFALYEPVFNAALQGNAPIVPGNLDRNLLPALHQAGWAALDDQSRADLVLPADLPDDIGPALRTAIADSHCGALPDRAIRPFAEIQFARDARMAHALMTANARDGAILIAGAEHVRKDRAVPYQLQRLKARGTVVTVAFVETGTGQPRPEDYDLRPYDYVWFTPGPTRAAPCLPKG